MACVRSGWAMKFGDKIFPSTVELHNQVPEKPVAWIEEKFVSVSEIFPHWMTAKPMLTDFVQRTKDWVVSNHSDVPSNIGIGLEFPNVWDEISGGPVPMMESFPPEDRPKVIGICHTLMADYLPDLSKYRLELVTETTFESIKCAIRSRESYVTSLGGRPVKAELAFRLGLWGLE